MPMIEIAGVSLNYELSGPSGAPVVAFSNSLGTDFGMWDRLVPHLRGRYRVLRYDTRGHGKSSVVDEPFTIEDLADDLAGLLSALGIGKAHVCGLSLGGMTGQVFAVRHADRLSSLTLMATSAFMPSEASWGERAALVRTEGTAAIWPATAGRWFTKAFHDVGAPLIQLLERAFTGMDREGYARCCEAIGRMDLRPNLARIATPTLVIAGRGDPSTPSAMAEEIANGIKDADLVVLADAAHLLAFEQPERAAAQLLGFLDRQPRDAHDGSGASFETGVQNRKAVLGAEHVERSLNAADAFALPWHRFISRVAWGDVWGDPRLSWKTRSMLTLTMMVALHREEEFKLHLRPALGNGVSLDELQAMLMQSAIYAGVPAANAGFRWVKEVLGNDLPA